jgi:hypothetical protein
VIRRSWDIQIKNALPYRPPKRTPPIPDPTVNCAADPHSIELAVAKARLYFLATFGLHAIQIAFE